MTVWQQVVRKRPSLGPRQGAVETTPSTSPVRFLLVANHAPPVLLHDFQASGANSGEAKNQVFAISTSTAFSRGRYINSSLERAMMSQSRTPSIDERHLFATVSLCPSQTFLCLFFVLFLPNSAKPIVSIFCHSPWLFCCDCCYTSDGDENFT